MLHASCPVIVSTWNSVPPTTFLGTKPYNIRRVVSKSGHFTHDMTFFTTTCVKNVLVRTGRGRGET